MTTGDTCKQDERQLASTRLHNWSINEFDEYDANEYGETDAKTGNRERYDGVD